jgi:putative cell wall-binding protein
MARTTHVGRSALSLLLALALAALAAVTGPAVAGADVSRVFDGDPTTTTRLHARGPGAAGIEVSRARFRPGEARVAVLSRDDVFPDSLAGSALTTQGPLLFTPTTALATRTRAELQRVLPRGGTVYLLGGTAALSEAVAQRVRDDGYRVVRLSGRDRVETALAVAAEVVRLSGSSRRVLLARSGGTRRDPTAGWADSVTAGGVAARDRTPVLLTATDALDPRVGSWLRARGVSETILLGGTAALSDAVARAVPGARRISGGERTATAAAVARALWPSRARLTVTSARHRDAWAHGLAAAGLAADAGAPLLLVEQSVGAAVRSIVARCGPARIDKAIVGDGTIVTPRVRETLDAYDGRACGRDGTLAFSAQLTGYSSCDEALADLRAEALERVGPWGLEGGGVAMPGIPGDDEATDGDSGGAPAPAPGAPAGGGGGGGEAPRSGTNVQEEGVDEPDIVKDDGRIVAAVAGGRLRVVDVSGAQPVVRSSTPLQGWGHQLLLDGRDLVVFSVDRRGGDAAQGPWVPATTVTTVDLSDPASPRVTGAMHVDGTMTSARMIDGTVRLVVQSGPHDLPFAHPSDRSEQAMALAAERNRQVVRTAPLSAFLPGYRLGATDPGAAGEQPLLDCTSVARPPWSEGLETVSVVTFDAATAEPTSSAAVIARGDLVYASLSTLVVSTSRWSGDEPILQGEAVTTELHAFDIADPGATAYVASGSVAGHLLNSFSLSEHEGLLRVATTSQPPWRCCAGDQETESHVRVLEQHGSELRQVGVVGGLGRGERIFAVRYLGDVAAVVTFRQVDPLYLVDLSDPRNPRVRGELKIPGFSRYLHPVAPGRLLGVGQDATDDGRTTGLQVSLFDIADLANPRRLAQLTYEHAHSEVEQDHKAFLYWEPSTLAVVPFVRYDRAVTSGAVGIGVGATTLSERGRTAHPSSNDPWLGIRRSFVVDDVLYTMSEHGLGRHRLSDLTRTAFAAFE